MRLDTTHGPCVGDPFLSLAPLAGGAHCRAGPIYQPLLTDSDFWRGTNSLQLDETIGLYTATILDARASGIDDNNHPLVPMSTLRAGFRLTLHGLSTEMAHAFLMARKAAQASRAPVEAATA